MRFALFGAGRIGQMHARNLAKHQHIELAYVFDVVPAAAEQCASEHAAVATTDADACLKDPTVDAVLIASSTDTHIDLLERSVRAGKAVLCEKPIDLDIARVDACWQRIAEHQPRIMLGFNRRFDPSFKAVRDAVQAGEIGELRQVVITSRDPGLPPLDYMKVSGGLMRDMTIHDFDLARYVLGEEPVQVSAMASALINDEVASIGDHDTAMVMLQTKSGKQCSITNHRSAAYGYDQRLEVLGELGMLKAENRRPTTVERWTAKATESKDPVLHFFIERYSEAYDAEIDAFVDALVNGTEFPVNFEDGRRALILANAAYESLARQTTITIG